MSYYDILKTVVDLPHTIPPIWDIISDYASMFTGNLIESVGNKVLRCVILGNDAMVYICEDSPYLFRYTPYEPIEQLYVCDGLDDLILIRDNLFATTAYNIIKIWDDNKCIHTIDHFKDMEDCVIDNIIKLSTGGFASSSGSTILCDDISIERKGRISELYEVEEGILSSSWDGKLQFNKLDGSFIRSIDMVYRIYHCIITDNKIICGLDNKTMVACDYKTGIKLYTLYGDMITRLLVSQTNNLICGYKNGDVSIISTDGIVTKTFNSHNNYIWGIRVLLDGNIITSAYNECAKLIDSSGECLKEFTGNFDDILMFSNGYIVLYDDKIGIFE